jgi:hypothetical protein
MSVLVGSVGHQLADVPMILAGIDPCFSCNDRMTVVRRGQASQPAQRAEPSDRKDPLPQSRP